MQYTQISKFLASALMLLNNVFCGLGLQVFSRFLRSYLEFAGIGILFFNAESAEGDAKGRGVFE